MEINTSDLSNLINITPIKATESSVAQNTQATAPQNTDTVSLSAAAIALSSTDNESTEIGSETDIDPQQQIDQLKSTINQDPNQAIFAQAGKITDTTVRNLLG